MLTYFEFTIAFPTSQIYSYSIVVYNFNYKQTLIFTIRVFYFSYINNKFDIFRSVLHVSVYASKRQSVTEHCLNYFSSNKYFMCDLVPTLQSLFAWFFFIAFDQLALSQLFSYNAMKWSLEETESISVTKNSWTTFVWPKMNYVFFSQKRT